MSGISSDFDRAKLIENLNNTVELYNTCEDKESFGVKNIRHEIIDNSYQLYLTYADDCEYPLLKKDIRILKPDHNFWEDIVSSMGKFIIQHHQKGGETNKYQKVAPDNDMFVVKRLVGQSRGQGIQSRSKELPKSSKRVGRRNALSDIDSRDILSCSETLWEAKKGEAEMILNKAFGQVLPYLKKCNPYPESAEDIYKNISIAISSKDFDGVIRDDNYAKNMLYQVRYDKISWIFPVLKSDNTLLSVEELASQLEKVAYFGDALNRSLVDWVNQGISLSTSFKEIDAKQYCSIGIHEMGTEKICRIKDLSLVRYSEFNTLIEIPNDIYTVKPEQIIHDINGCVAVFMGKIFRHSLPVEYLRADLSAYANDENKWKWKFASTSSFDIDLKGNDAESRYQSYRQLRKIVESHSTEPCWTYELNLQPIRAVQPWNTMLVETCLEDCLSVRVRYYKDIPPDLSGIIKSVISRESELPHNSILFYSIQEQVDCLELMLTVECLSESDTELVKPKLIEMIGEPELIDGFHMFEDDYYYENNHRLATLGVKYYPTKAPQLLEMKIQNSATKVQPRQMKLESDFQSMFDIEIPPR
ncbi:MAG: hypothetical protein VX777_08680 [Chlamydiota bacterium]|nr:hypothetical protein [Chlamydiota bacterium]